MNANEPEKPKKSWGSLQWGVVIGTVILVIYWLVSSIQMQYVRAPQMKAGSNVRQIVSLLMTYASDNNGLYPDAAMTAEGLTSNAVFRELFKEGLVGDETIFGGLYSRFQPDKNIGPAPDFPQALEPGENHWMMMAGQDGTTASPHPLIFENTVDATWPPRWLKSPSKPPAVFFSHHFINLKSPPPRGRSWPGGTILMARSDASVETFRLVEREGFLHLPESTVNPQESLPLPVSRLLDVEDK